MKLRGCGFESWRRILYRMYAKSKQSKTETLKKIKIKVVGQTQEIFFICCTFSMFIFWKILEQIYFSEIRRSAIGYLFFIWKRTAKLISLSFLRKWFVLTRIPNKCCVSVNNIRLAKQKWKRINKWSWKKQKF